MKITIECEPKEIADLVLLLQSRQCGVVQSEIKICADAVDDVIRHDAATHDNSSLSVDLKEQAQKQAESYSDKLKCTLEHIGKSRGHNSNIMVEEIKRDKKGATYKITNCNPLNHMDLPKPYIWENYYEDCVIDKLYEMFLSLLQN